MSDTLVQPLQKDLQRVVKSRKRNTHTPNGEHWLKTYWRPMMGVVYGIICFMDYVGFPTISMIVPVVMKYFNIPWTYIPWVPLTAGNGGMIHMSFAAIVGVSAWSHGQENIKNISSTTTTTPAA